MTHVLRRGQVAALVFFLFVTSHVHAQNQPSAQPGAQPPTNDENKEKPSAPPPVKEEITVTGTRFERPIDLTPQAISVLPAEAIHERPMWNVAALLEDVPGVSFSRTGAVDGQVVIRGFSSNDSRMVMFVDGDRFRGRPSLEYSFLDPNEIDRMEIIRGPAAALYGADAMNGVVNAITRRATGDPLQQGFSLLPRLYAAGVSSANNLGATRLELQGVGNGFDALVAANYRTAGNYESPRGEIPNSDFSTHSFNARIGYSPSATQRFEAIAKLANIVTGRANAPGAPLVTTRNTPLEEKSLRLAYTGSQVASWIQDVEASAYVRDMHTVIRSDTRTATNGNVEHRDTWVVGPTVSGGKLLARSVLGKSVLSYGVDLYNENVPPFEDEVRTVNQAGALVSFSPRADRIRAVVQTDGGAFAHYDWDPSPQWTASLSGRYDAVRTNIDSKPALGESPELSAAFARNLTANDHALTGSAGVIFRPVSALHFVGNISTAFRTPTTFDKSGSGVVGALNTIPNAELKPESSKTYEAGVRVRLRALNANFTAFRSDYDDLLQYVFLDPVTRQRQNVGRAKMEGFELDGTWEMTKELACRFNVSNTRGTNTVTNVPVPYVPPLNGQIGLRHTWTKQNVWVELTDRWSRDKTRIDPTQERPTDGYHVFSLYSGTDLGRFRPELKAYRLTVGIENLNNKAYRLPASRELVGFPILNTNPLLEPGRSLTINLTAEF